MASAIRPEFLAACRRRADAAGTMTYARFVDLALYDPEVGYYTRSARRVGRTPDTDFFTSESLGPIFGELLVQACLTLLGEAHAGRHAFVEIGNEAVGSGGGPAESGALAGVAHPFASVRNLPLGRPLKIPPRAVVFSNELFDAQPFHRLIWREGTWCERGVAVRDDRLEEVMLPGLSPAVQAVAGRLPPRAADGYQIDLPLGAEGLLRRIATGDWSGLFIAFDYGKTWRELVEATPVGTARAYHRHRQSNDLLARPGEQDLTCHICWDWLADALEAAGFAAPVLVSQEAFLVHHAGPALRRMMSAEADRLSERKLGLMQLLHPGNMGRKFQVLWALRP